MTDAEIYGRASDYLLARILETIKNEARTVDRMVAGTDHHVGTVALGACLVAGASAAGAAYAADADEALLDMAQTVFPMALANYRNRVARSAQPDATVVDETIDFGGGISGRPGR